MADAVHVSLDNREGVSGKAMAWSVIGSLVVGLGLGAWSVSAFLRFEPSEEYHEVIAELEVSRSMASDSVRMLQRQIRDADREAEEAAEEAEDAWEAARSVRVDAAVHRARADSLSEVRADEDDVELLILENVELREAVEKMSVTNAFQRQALVQMEATVFAQRLGIQQRDAQIGLLTREVDEQERALRVAMGEVSRATGQLSGWKWKVGIGTIGIGALALLAF